MNWFPPLSLSYTNFVIDLSFRPQPVTIARQHISNRR